MVDKNNISKDYFNMHKEWFVTLVIPTISRQNIIIDLIEMISVQSVIPKEVFIFDQSDNINIAKKDLEKLDYFMHSNEHSDLNTFNPKNVKSKYFYKKISLRLNTLEKTLDKILKKKQNRIGFMSIDVEGYDLKVLKSNDWDRYRPSVVVVEFNGNMLDVYKSPIYEYLNDLSYEPVSKTSTNINFGNLFFIDKKIKWNL